jgi:secondary thiamine-phosphate synthase enzyme
MSVYTNEIKINTNGEVDIINITDELQKIAKDSKINNGIMCVFIPGSTGTVTTIEFEPGLKKDFPYALEKLAPKNEYYSHHETWHDDNGH